MSDETTMPVGDETAAPVVADETSEATAPEAEAPEAEAPEAEEAAA